MNLPGWGMLLEIQMLGKEVRKSRQSNTCLKKTTPREKELDGFVFVCSEVMATEHSFSKINCFSILKKKKNQMKVIQENILLSQPNESICAKAKESSWGVCSRERALY